MVRNMIDKNKKPSLAFDSWVMEAYEEMWENQEEEIEPTEDEYEGMD